MDVSQEKGQQVDADDPAIEVGAKFLSALFAESDTVLFRPIETWTEEGKKRSRVIYKSVIYRTATPQLLTVALRQLMRVAATEHANIFFGACPRVGDNGQFDQAWQIRTVRALWCDIDNVSVEVALERVVKAGLPIPSIVVNSGNGVHLYWLLTEPCLIDDGADPPPVFVEWNDGKDGKKRPRKFLKEPGSGERLYLDVRANVPELTSKAINIQDIIAGIASAIGGDHTQDLSRLLRVPGTFNRKDERNDRAPVLCELVSCNTDLRYPLTEFAKFTDKSPQKTQRKQIAAVRLPTPKKLTPTKRDKLSELVNACAAAPVGTRSQADWRLVCTAIEKGWPRSDVWAAASTVGKFAERGEAYFERTWTKAEGQTRERIFCHAATHERGKRKGTSGTNGSHVGLTGEPEGAEEADPGLVATLAHLICEKETFAQDEGGKLYRYKTGVYKARGEAFVKTRVKKLCRKLKRLKDWSSHVANEVVEFIRVDSPLLWQRPPSDVINVKNGLLNIATGELGEHSPSHLSAVQLPVVYDPMAICPKIDKFVSEVFPEDATSVAYEIPGWLMTPDTSIQKAVLLIGPGGNGKSRYLRMVEAFLGKVNVSNLSLHRLESDKFACARLYGKLANICPDLPTEHLAGTSIFKAITGGDPVTGEYKFKDSFDFVPYSRLVFSANNPPRAHDASEGFFDRWIVVPFERRFRGERGEIRADKLDAMLCEPSEQSGLLNRALASLGRLRSAGRFSDCSSLESAFSEFHAATDPLSVWLDGQTVEGPRFITTKRALISAFSEHCERKGRSPMSEQAFGGAIKRLRPDVTDAQRTVSGKVQWCYVGIGLKTESPLAREDDVDSPAYANPQGDSRASRALRDLPSINLSHAREHEPPEEVDYSPVEQDREKRVKRVKRVNDPGPTEVACEHVWQDVSTGDGRARRSCSKCQKFYGYVDLGANQRRLGA
jgi:P4 family phage/plasmid primase-like protien